MKTNWFQRHLNWTWVMIWIIVVAIAYSVLIYFYRLPAPIKSTMSTENVTVTSYNVDGSKYSETTWLKPVLTSSPDYKAKDTWVNNALYYWWWPVYIAGNIIGGRWILKQKRRSLHWLWLTPLFPIVLLIVENRRATEQLINEYKEKLKENENGNTKQEN